MKKDRNSNPVALVPILVFLVLYLGTGIIFEYVMKIPMGFYNVPIIVAFMAAILVACMQNSQLKFDEKLDVMAKGLADRNIVTMLLIFITAGIFVGVVGRSSAESVAYFMLSIIPAKFAVAVLFIVACFVSTAMGTSVGTITLITPIAVAVSEASGFSMALCVASVMGGGILGYGAIMGASIIGGLFESVLGFMLKPLRRFFPAVVTGTVVLSIGLSLIGVGVNSFGGGNSANDFGSIENLLLGTIVLVIIIALKHGTKGITSASSVLIGIIAGYIIAGIMGVVLPTTAVNADGVEYTKAWVLNWDKVAQAGWFAIPKFMPVKIIFDARAIVPVLIMFIVTAVETVGDISGVIEGGMDREATDSELSGGVVCDGIGSTIAAFFGVLPNTSFSQNVGLVTMTKIVNRFALATGAIFLILCGLFPKLAALISIMPQSVLGGAAVMMFSSIVISGIQLITKEPLTMRNITIVSVALGLGYGIGANSTVLSGLPEGIQLIFGGSGIVPAALVAIILNIALPKED